MATPLIFFSSCLSLLYCSPIFSLAISFPGVHCLLVVYHSLVTLTYLFLVLSSAVSSQFVSLLFLLSVSMKPSVRFHSCVFLCAFLTSLPLDSVLKISHVTLSLCCPKAVGGFSSASLSSFSFWRCCQCNVRRQKRPGKLRSWEGSLVHISIANSKAGEDNKQMNTGPSSTGQFVGCW